MTDDEHIPRTLYVGNLDPLVTEDLLLTLFGQWGECKSCKIISEANSDPYAFIEFVDHNSAITALSMHKRRCMGKEMKVNWATTSGHQGKIDLSHSEHFHIFVGDLAPEVDAQQLRESFSPFGDISDVKIMKDPHTHVHKGYGFISFVKKVDAETAIASMNGQWIGTRKIRTNWATRKVQPGTDMQGGMPGGAGGSKYIQKLDYNEVWSRSSENNTTVYCGGISGINEDLIRSSFAPYGPILAVHPFPDRGYAFVRFATKEAACNAICGVHGMDINGCTAKCSWGKENIEMASPLSSGNYVNQQATSLSSLQQNTNAAAAATNVWAAAAQQNPNWAAANYQWTGYPPNTMNYWQQYPGYQK